MHFNNLLILLFFPFVTFAQKDTLRLQEIKIQQERSSSNDNVFHLDQKAIRELQPTDLGDVMLHFSGINIRSYGGLGGLKTVSVRNIGSQQTSVVVDGYTLINTQTGQVNFAQVQTDNLFAVKLITGGSGNVMLPGSALVNGSCLLIETVENNMSIEKSTIRAATKVGSFGQYDNYFLIKQKIKNSYLSVSGKYRFSQGNYPYKIENGYQTIKGTRQNNRYEDFFSTISFKSRIGERSSLHLQLRKDFMDQELPGAIVLYSQNTPQYLTTSPIFAMGSLQFHFNTAELRIFAQVSENKTEYRDPFFLNNQGGIHAVYNNRLLNAGINFSGKINSHINYYAAIENTYAQLEAKTNFSVDPIRNHSFSVVGMEARNTAGKAKIQLGQQIVVDWMNQQREKTIQNYQPLIQLESRDFTKFGLHFFGFYKHSFRMPTFNELYYNYIGNIDLIPEKAEQLATGFHGKWTSKKIEFHLKNEFYFNRVEDKIVAIPTKNLFVWSMQNVGLVNILGVESNVQFVFKRSVNFSLANSSNITFQRVIDVTSPNLPTYRHQLAYSPSIVLNNDTRIMIHKIGWITSFQFNSMRYSLNENITMNELPSFFIVDIGLNREFVMRKNRLIVQFNVKNVSNESYAVIKNYVMPGRNYLLSLHYAFN